MPTGRSKLNYVSAFCNTMHSLMVHRRERTNERVTILLLLWTTVQNVDRQGKRFPPPYATKAQPIRNQERCNQGSPGKSKNQLLAAVCSKTSEPGRFIFRRKIFLSTFCLPRSCIQLTRSEIPSVVDFPLQRSDLIFNFHKNTFHVGHAQNAKSDNK